jgi:hypothetical protein
MERTVPSATSEEIRLYLTTLYSLLRSTSEVQVRTLEEVHAGMNSLLHPNARHAAPDISAFVYSLLRLPNCMPQVRSIILGQSDEVFSRHGFPMVESWQPVSARARRRRCFFDGSGTLACYIASRSDIEDILPGLTAFQIEWNKLHDLLISNWPSSRSLAECDESPTASDDLARKLLISPDDLERLRSVWLGRLIPNLETVRALKCSFAVRLLSGSLSAYQRATHGWWEAVEHAAPDLRTRPVYIVSSNNHSLLNLITGFALHHEEELVDFVQRGDTPELQLEWQSICERQERTGVENFLYYTLKKAQQSPQGASLLQAQAETELELSIQRIPSEQTFDVEAQVIKLARLDPAQLDPRLRAGQNDLDRLTRSDAIILNIDYPLGLAAYNLLSKIAEQAGDVLGIYVMGKAATLNGARGDVMIPNVVQDEHSRNSYLFDNCFCAADVSPHLMYGTVLDNQKSISVLGTFLQNASIMDVFYREGYADIEMEAGPYLSAVYEMFRPKRHPVNEIVNLYGLPFDLGILHYASDTPLSKGTNLGAGTLSYFGLDSTYATTLAIARRILHLEINRLGNQPDASG